MLRAIRRPPRLGAADYQLVAHTGSRDLFTFCMCPAGYIMPSVSEPGYFGTNGMSDSRRDTPFANSGLVVTIGLEDLGSQHPLAGVHFQQSVERLAYLAGGGTYHLPDPVGPRLPQGAAEPRQDPVQLRTGHRPDESRTDPPAGRHGSTRSRTSGHGPPDAWGVPPGRHLVRPRITR